VGLHFAGRFLQANYAVPAAVVAARVEQVLRPKPGRPRPSAGAIPVKPSIGTPTPARPSGPDVIVESVPADYVGRAGYDAAFLGPKVPLPVVGNKKDVLTFPWKGARNRC
jgi:endonuclease G